MIKRNTIKICVFPFIKCNYTLNLNYSGVNYKGQLLPGSRQASSNTSEGGVNRESSLDDSGVVDDHDDQDITTELVNASTIEVHENAILALLCKLKNDFLPL